MDPRHRADQALARASARGAFVVTPDNATSPMDASTTVRIPREIIGGGQNDTDTLAFPHSSPQPEAPTSWPQHDYGQVPTQPDPYQTQHQPNPFGQQYPNSSY
jgi:hypothetical protein